MKVCFRNAIIILFPALLFYQCNMYLPHSGFNQMTNTLPKPAYTGENNSWFVASAGYINYNIWNDENLDSIDLYPEQRFQSILGEFGWVKTYKYFSYGGSIFGYTGTQRTYLFNNELENNSFYGFGGKGDLGFMLPLKKINWHVLDYQVSIAWDKGEYPEYRNTNLWRNEINNNNQIVPSEAVALSQLIYTQFIFFPQNKVGFSIQVGLLNYGYLYNGYQDYLGGYNFGGTFRYKQFHFGINYNITIFDVKPQFNVAYSF